MTEKQEKTYVSFFFVVDIRILIEFGSFQEFIFALMLKLAWLSLMKLMN